MIRKIIFIGSYWTSFPELHMWETVVKHHGDKEYLPFTETIRLFLLGTYTNTVEYVNLISKEKAYTNSYTKKLNTRTLGFFCLFFILCWISGLALEKYSTLLKWISFFFLYFFCLSYLKFVSLNYYYFKYQ